MIPNLNISARMSWSISEILKPLKKPSRSVLIIRFQNSRLRFEFLNLAKPDNILLLVFNQYSINEIRLYFTFTSFTRMYYQSIPDTLSLNPLACKEGTGSKVKQKAGSLNCKLNKQVSQHCNNNNNNFISIALLSCAGIVSLFLVLRWLDPVILWGYHPNLKLSGIPTFTWS